MTALLFEAFLRTLENDGVRSDVRDQARLQLVFSAQRDWSVAAVRGTLRVLLTHDEGERASFDRLFDAFFRQSLQCDRGPRIDFADWLAQWRTRPSAETLPSAPAAARSAVAARQRAASEARDERGRSAWWRIAQPFRRIAQRVGALVRRLRDWLEDWRQSRRSPEPPSAPADETIPRQVNVGRQMFSFASVGAPLEPILTSRAAVAGRRRAASEAGEEKGWSAWRRIGQPFRRFAQRVRDAVHRLSDWLEDWRQSRRSPEPPPSPADETIPWQVNVGRQTFSFASVGAPLEPILTIRQVKRLADMLGFFRTELAGRRPDVSAAVRTSVRAGDPGRMCFQPLAATRHVLVLEDALALREVRTSLADELCSGLEATGVTVERGRFRYAVDRWTNPRGAEVDLGDLESERDGYVVLLFTDGSSFGRPAAWQALQRLADWPRVAWIDWREPRWRIAASQVPQAAGISQFSATPEGLLAALTSFLMPGHRPDESDAAAASLARLLESEMGLDRYINAVMDDAFLWAADCSLLQPCSLALAERLRRRFHPAVPRIALHRVLRLPGIRQDAAGMAFSPPTLAVLRRGWLARRPDDQQEAVLRFIARQLQAARPTAAPKGSLAQLLWTASVERVSLELERDNDLVRFAQVLHSPAGRWLLSSLAGHFAPRCVAKQDQIVPLRMAPIDEQGRKRLAEAVPGADQDAPTISRPLDVVWLAPGEFVMGSREDEPGRSINELRHRVGITRRFGLGKYPVTQSQYAEVMGQNPSYFPNAGPDAPVEQVDWYDAMEFCRQRTELDRQSGKLPEGYVYTLPTEAQWEYACRAGTRAATYAGDLQVLGHYNGPVLDGIAWYGGNSGVEYVGGVDSSGWREKQHDHQRAGTHSVGQKQSNPSGFHDMLGNVWEWCADWYAEFSGGYAVDPWGPDEGSSRVVRGGSWGDRARYCRSACRIRSDPGRRLQVLGFRVAVVQSAELKGREHEGRLRGQELVWLEPGEFLMDSPESEVGRSSDERQHPVRITRPFAMGKYPVTQSQYEEVIGSNPSYFQEVGPDAPVEGVNWEEAMEFCRRLTERDRDSGLLSKGYAYTLPTEAQWEYACRAGTSTPFSFGESLSSDLANFDGNHPYGAEKGPYLERTTSVGTYLSNAWDLHDMHGNVWEWCYDRYGAHTAEEAVDPRGPETGPYRVVRGGSWYLGARYCRSACRLARDPGERDRDLGFRVAAVPSAELKARERKGQRRARWAFLLPLAQRTEL